jgi:hypothetical protein
MWVLLIGALVQDQKALDYLKSAPRSWACVAEDAFAGLAYLSEGSTPKSGRYSQELQACVKSMMRDLRGDFTENWYLALELLFLSEVYKKDPTSEIKDRIAQVIQRAEQTQEATGGWSHSKGYNYKDRGGNVPDVAMVGTFMLAGLCNVRAAGLDAPGKLIDSVFAYCEKSSDGSGGLIYGTNNRVPDFAGTRAAGLLIALHVLNRKDERYERIAKLVKEKMAHIEKGHANAPVHYFASGVACYLSGSWDDWKKTWMDKLLGQREPDGSVWLKIHEAGDHERNVLRNNILSTATLAILCNLDQGRLFQPKPSKEEKSSPRLQPAKPKSPFSTRPRR